jgi:ABC-type sugar transport system permease subunit
MVAPALILALALGIYPMLSSLVMSFQHYDLLRIREIGTPFAGFDNYIAVFSDPRFLQTVGNTVLFTIIAVAISVTMGLFLAQIVNANFRGRAIVRTLVCIPWFVPPVVAAAIWMWLLQTDRSPINYLLSDLGLIDSNIRFLTDTSTLGPVSIPMLAVSVVRAWNGLPFIVIFLLAGLQSIPTSLYEAADVDGANVWQKFRFITLPMLKPVLAVLLTLLFMGGLGHFEINYVMTGGGPQNLTNIMAVYSYQQAFMFFKFDYAAAASGVILVMTSLISIFYIRTQVRTSA